MNKRILNVGCGESCYGTHRLDIIKRKNVTHLGEIEKGLPFKDAYFDEVYAMSIFEHLGNPLNFLLECKRVLKKGGKLRVWTDNGNWLLFIYNKIKIVHGDYRYFGDKINEKDMHFQFFQPEHIRNYFWKAGFDRKTIKTEIKSCIEEEGRGIKLLIIRKLLETIFGKRLGSKWIYAEAKK